MSLPPETKQFINRVVDGALDTIEVSGLFAGSHWGLDDPERRRIAGHIAVGTIAHLTHLAERHGGMDDFGRAVAAIAAGFMSEDAQP